MRVQGGPVQEQEAGVRWRCRRCGRTIAYIRRWEGYLEVKHKCGTWNRLDGRFNAEGDQLDPEDNHR